MTQTPKKVAYIAILAALSFILGMIQISSPVFLFLKLDFAILPVLIGLMLLDWKSSLAILYLRGALQLIFLNKGPETWIGLPMNLIAYSLFILAFAWIWKKRETLSSYVLAAVVGTLGVTAVMAVLNVVYALPLYLKLMNFNLKEVYGVTVAQYILATNIPFNLVQGFIIAVLFYVIYIALKATLRQLK